MKRIQGEKCTLADLKEGQLGKVLAIYIKNQEVRRHLMELGMISGTTVKIKKIAPFGDPIVLELRGYELFLDKMQLKSIQVEVIR